MTVERNMIAVKINRDFDPKLIFTDEASGGLWPLTGTYEVRFYRYGITSPFLTCTVGSGIASINTSTSTIQMQVPADSLASIEQGYGTLELLRTDAGSDSIAIVNVAYVQASAGGNSSDIQEYAVFSGGITVLVVSALGAAAHVHAAASTTVAGFMSPSDKSKLNGIDVATGVASGIAAHVALPDPHSQYMLEATTTTEFERGTQALMSFAAAPKMLGEKFALVDFVARGAAFTSEGTDQLLCTIENIPSLIKTNSTGGKGFDSKLREKTYAANAIRYTYGADGGPRGALFELAHTYQNVLSQPTVAQLGASTNAANAALPANQTGNWIAVNTIGSLFEAYSSFAVTSGQTYHYNQEIIMDDGSAPVPSMVTTTGDFSPVMQSAVNGLNQATAAAGMNVLGPLADGKYYLQTYFVASATGTFNFGIAKYAAQSAKNFKLGRRNFGPGRYSPTMFDIATLGQNNRAGDVFRLPLSGFITDEITIAIEMEVPIDVSVQRRIFVLYLDASNYAEVLFNTSSGPFVNIVAGGVTLFNGVSAALTVGSTYKMALSLSRSKKRALFKATGAALLTLNTSFTGSFAPAELYLGSYFNGAIQLNSTVERVMVSNAAATAAIITSYVG